MDENLIGYLLNALEPREQREVEDALHNFPETQRRLELLRQALDPLAVDSEASDPPSGLWVRTLARVAEHRCRELPRADQAGFAAGRRATRLAAAGRRCGGWDTFVPRPLDPADAQLRSLPCGHPGVPEQPAPFTRRWTTIASDTTATFPTSLLRRPNPETWLASSFRS